MLYADACKTIDLNMLLLGTLHYTRLTFALV